MEVTTIGIEGDCTSMIKRFLINGYGVPEAKTEDDITDAYNELLDYYQEQKYTIIGKGTEGFTLDEVTTSFANVKRARIDISAHGQIVDADNNIILTYDVNNNKHRKFKHQLQNGPNNWIDSYQVVKAIVLDKKAQDIFFEIHLWSCYAGAAVSNLKEEIDSNLADVLPLGSIFIAHGPVVVDAWSHKLYKAHHRSIEAHNDTNGNDVVIALPHDAIECLSIAVKTANAVKQFNIRSIPVADDVMIDLDPKVAEWKALLSNIEQQSGIKFELTLDFGNEAALKDFVNSMHVTYLRSDPENFLIAISAIDSGDKLLQSLIERNAEDIRDELGAFFNSQKSPDFTNGVTDPILECIGDFLDQ
jgi:hypothetical protein